MKKSLLFFTLSFGFYFAFGQCGPYTLTDVGSNYYNCQHTLNVSGASAAQRIIWNLNGVPFDTVYSGPIGVTVAGGNGYGSAANQLFFPSSVFVDGSGNIYVADMYNYRIQKFPAGSTYATNGITVAGGNGSGSAANQLDLPSTVCLDGLGNIYVADGNNERIQKFPAGSTSAINGVTVAGGNGFGTAANQLSSTLQMRLDSAGNIYVCDGGNNRIQKFPVTSTSDSNGVTVAGGNGYGSAANQLNSPSGVFVDRSGNIYVADQGNNRIQEFPSNSTSATNGITVAGGNQTWNPEDVFIDSSGNIYVSDNLYIQKFPPGSTSTTNGVTVAGGNGQGTTANQFEASLGIYVDGSGNIYVADPYNFRIQKWGQPAITGMDTGLSSVTTSAGTYSALVTDSSGCTVSSDMLTIGPALSSFYPTSAIMGDLITIRGKYLSGVSYVTFGGTPASSIFVLNDSTMTARVAAGSSGTIQVSNSCVSDSLTGFIYLGTGGQCGPYAMTATDSSCTSFVLTLSGASSAGQIIWEKNGVGFDTTYAIPPGTIVAGGNGQSDSADDLYAPYGVFVDGAGYLYVADQLNNRVQKFPPGSTSATNGVTIAGGNGQGSAANQLNTPWGIWVDNSGNVYVGDSYNDRVQKFPAGSTSATNGITVAGGNGAGGSANQLESPSGICMDRSGNLYVADFINDRIQKFPPGSTSATNAVTVAGGNGQGSAANQLYYATGVYVDSLDNMYVADQLNNRVLEFPVGGTPLIGNTVAGGNGQGSAANQLNDPTGVYVDRYGNIYVADAGNNRVLKFPSGSTSATNGITIAGQIGLGGISNIEMPIDVYGDASGNIYVSDQESEGIQKYAPSGIDTSIIVTSPGTYSALVTDTAGCIAQSDTISAHPGVTAYFTLQQSNTPHLWYIVNQCSGPGTLSYVWNWGDSTTSTGDTTSHTYATAGYYNVCVTATSSMGCSATYCDTNAYLYKNQSGQMVYVEVLSQFPAGINTINTENLNINYYANAVHFSEALQAPTLLKLYDMSGRVVMEQDDFSGSTWTIRSDIAQGIYIVQLQNANYSLTKKLMILQ